jgi:hypothetical protein
MDQQQCAHERVAQFNRIEESFMRRVCSDCGLYLNRTANEIARASMLGAARALGREAGPTPPSACADSPNSLARTR